MHALGIVIHLGLIAALAACGDPAGPDVVRTQDGLEYRAWTDILESFPVQLRTHVEIRNRTAKTVEIEFPDGCVVLVRAYLEGSSRAAWDQALTVGCTDALVRIRLGPGESTRQVAATGAREILGDSLPDGQYRLQAYLRPRPGTVVIEAGSAPLSVPRS